MSKKQEALRFLDDLDSLNADTVAVTMPSTDANPSNVVDHPPSTATPGSTAGAGKENEADALAFLDEITQKSMAVAQPSSSVPSHRSTPPHSIGLAAGRSLSSTPRTASRISLRKGADGSASLSRSGSPAPGRVDVVPTTGLSSATTPSGGAASMITAPGGSAASPAGTGGWGWSSVWSTASAAVKQARTVVDEQVKNLPVSIPNVSMPNNEQAKKWSEGMLDYVKNTQLDKLGSFHHPHLGLC